MASIIPWFQSQNRSVALLQNSVVETTKAACLLSFALERVYLRNVRFVGCASVGWDAAKMPYPRAIVNNNVSIDGVALLPLSGGGLSPNGVGWAVMADLKDDLRSAPSTPSASESLTSMEEAGRLAAVSIYAASRTFQRIFPDYECGSCRHELRSGPHDVVFVLRTTATDVCGRPSRLIVTRDGDDIGFPDRSSNGHHDDPGLIRVGHGDRDNPALFIGCDDDRRFHAASWRFRSRFPSDCAGVRPSHQCRRSIANKQQQPHPTAIGDDSAKQRLNESFVDLCWSANDA